MSRERFPETQFLSVMACATRYETGASGDERSSSHFFPLYIVTLTRSPPEVKKCNTL
ncbi:hypothetical protein EVA_14024 [gut metagenome]|uniref:Uncharacterized protein n=1 Tax=gut metagenome TaxID=749906 RepID=J9FSD5_9ZZZZ